MIRAIKPADCKRRYISRNSYPHFTRHDRIHSRRPWPIARMSVLPRDCTPRGRTTGSIVESPHKLLTGMQHQKYAGQLDLSLSLFPAALDGVDLTKEACKPCSILHHHHQHRPGDDFCGRDWRRRRTAGSADGSHVSQEQTKVEAEP